MRYKILICLMFLCASFLHAQKAEVRWYTMEEAIAAQQVEARKIIVDMYTDWCGWCKKMDQSTFGHTRIADYLNANYYPVKFDAESKEEITFKGRDYKFLKSGKRGYHELAAALTSGRLSYPTIVVLDENLNVIQALRGYEGPERFEKIISYFAENYHHSTPWASYERNFRPTNSLVKTNR